MIDQGEDDTAVSWLSSEISVIGDGMTRRRRTTVIEHFAPTREGLDAFAASTRADPLEALGEAVVEWRSELEAICARHDCIWTGSAIRLKSRGLAPFEGLEPPYSAATIGQVFQSINGDEVPSEFVACAGRGWYLARLLQLSRRIDWHLERGEARHAVASALELGSVKAEMRWKAAAEPSWKTGQSSRRGGGRGRAMVADQNAHRNSQIQAEFAELITRKSQRDARAALVTRHGLSARQISRLTGGK